MKQPLLMFILTLFSLLFWGWLTDVLWLAGLLGLLLCGAYIKRGQYNFEYNAFYQIGNLCGLIIAAVFVFYWLDDNASKAILPSIRLLPLALLPLLLLQYLYKQHLVPSSALLFFQRKHVIQPTWFDVSVLFIFVCLLSAGATVHQGWVYFTGISALLLAFILVQQHYKQTRYVLLLIAIFLLAEVMGMGIVYGMQDLQMRLQAKMNAWLLSYNDGHQGSTAIGEVGRLQLSDSVLFRVKSEKKRSEPMLLLEGTYQRYRGQTWFGGGWKDINIPYIHERWQLYEGELGTSHLTFYQSFDGDKHVLALPMNTLAIAKLDVKSLSIRQGQRVEIQGLPPFAAYDVFYQDVHKFMLRGEVQRSDLDIPKNEKEAVAKVVAMLDLHEIKNKYGVEKVIKVLHQYFLQQYTYTTWLQISQQSAQTPLSSFLLEDKQGHCEYFASATVLLLRALGIPTRYAVGFSMSEYDADKDLYLVRGRDAHAWAVAKVDDTWINIDNTPPNWFSIENAKQSQFQGLWDWFSDIRFQFKKWRYGDSEIDKQWWYILLSILFGYLTIRVLRRVKTKQHADAKTVEKEAQDWLKIEQALAMVGLGRRNGETVQQWLVRIEAGKWYQLARLHDIQHYAAAGLSDVMQEEYQAYIQDIKVFCAQYKDRG
ncbi:transglutaminase-like domain-containing protein [Ghiorsea bivora]|uniref:transglutaminase-like domain-containing protein n=1 Tax=Ghiorsea bivora TaxID=1485545 RepID=UPI000570D7CD|nr:transglutaminase domain-containing protein [Ghiorsea bivora]